MVQASTGAYKNCLSLVFFNTVSKPCSGKSSLKINSLSNKLVLDSEPVLFFCSCRSTIALEPIRTASSSSFKPILSLYSSPVCNVSVLNPNAKIYRKLSSLAERDCMIFAFARVFPLPVEAILTAKKPNWYLSKSLHSRFQFLILMTASSCHL